MMTQESKYFTPQLTADGSYTFFSPEFEETFHSQRGAVEEAQKKFIEPCQLVEKAQNFSHLNLLDICYGLGYNSAAALATIWQINPLCQVHLIGLELNQAVPRQALDHQLLTHWQPPIPQVLRQLTDTYQVQTVQLQGKLLIGDARMTIQQVQRSGFQADAIFLDPFSPPKCPQLWTVEFLEWVAQCLKLSGRIATYSCAASVRTALRLAGLTVGSTPSVGRRSPGTVASWSPQGIPQLSQPEQEHLQTKAAIPYRDLTLKDAPTQIRQRRQAEQQTSALESTNCWKRRWS